MLADFVGDTTEIAELVSERPCPEDRDLENPFTLP